MNCKRLTESARRWRKVFMVGLEIKKIKFFWKNYWKEFPFFRPNHPRLPENSKIKGKVFVLTGTMASISRDKAKEEIKLRGGHTGESVSKNTDFVVAGAEPGSKYDKGEKIGVRIIDEKDFLELLS